MDLLTVLQQFVDMKAVLLAVFATQFLKCFLPTPDGGKSTDVIRGHWTTRMLPFVPVIIGFVVCYLLNAEAKYTADSAVKGVMSGVSASYGYRTTKVTVFGE